jgi:shikimate kinase
MGAGKTAVGRPLAARLGLPFLDTDEAIARSAGPIPAIFSSRGEAGFRALEAELVTREIRALEQKPKVLALGGGAVLSDEVRDALRRVPAVVWLTAPAAELWRRVGADRDAERPLARDQAAFSALLDSREALYREVATLTSDTSGRDAAQVVADLVERLADPGGPQVPAPDAPGMSAA